MIPNYVQIDMVIVSINTGNHTISLNKHTIGLEIYNSTRQYIRFFLEIYSMVVWVKTSRYSLKIIKFWLKKGKTRFQRAKTGLRAKKL